MVPVSLLLQTLFLTAQNPPKWSSMVGEESLTLMRYLPPRTQTGLDYNIIGVN